MRPSPTVLSLSVIATCVVTGALAFGDASEQRSIDPGKSKAQFSIKHIFVDRVVGTLPIVSGSIVLTSDSLIPVSATAILDPKRVSTGDSDRDASLDGSNYFDVNDFPTWKFTSTRIVPSGPGAFEMDGMLTIHGVTQLEHLAVVVGGDAAHTVYHATGQIDRRAFGMKGTRLDPVIGDSADVSLDIVLGAPDARLSRSTR
jgi:polyisoprenoid-binding protein YceI